VATALLLVAAVVVAAAILTSTLVAGAAVLSVLAGALSSRIVWTEVVQTRRDNAIERAEMARDFGVAMTKSLSEHQAYTQNVNARLASKDKTIVELTGTIRLAEKRADEAESRVKREAKRANEAQERLSVLLDEVLTANADLVEEEWASAGIPEAAELPTIVDLLAWEDRVNESIVEDLRHQA
jgi:chromosome segregation ATPase